MLSLILPSFLSLHTLFQLDMSQSASHDDRSKSIEVLLLKFFAVIGGFFFLLLFYTQKNKLLYLSRCFWSLCGKRVGTKDSSKRIGDQAAEADLEKGGSSVEVAVQQSEEQFRGVRSSAHARVLAYLYTLPRESHDFLEMREVSNCSSEERSAGQTSSDGDSAESSYGTDESLESNWVEIVHSFPIPPGADDLKVNSNEWNAPASGPKVVSDDTAICYTKHVATPGPSPEPTV
ncbi:hypothetical protein ACEPAI_2926 [Sanghuangporus weigelae]